MDDRQINVVRSDEVMDVYRTGQRSGFFVGVIFCVAAKYVIEHRREVLESRTES